MKKLLGVIFGGLLASCAVTSDSPPRDGVCANAFAEIVTDFPAGAGDDCAADPETPLFEMNIVPEDEDINPSPWYAFKVEPKAAESVIVVLTYHGAKHRYQPKISRDGETWERLPERLIEQPSESKIAMVLDTGGDTLWVAGQEILTYGDHMTWAEEQAQKPFVSAETIGQSAMGRDIVLLKTADEPGAERPYILLVGRQHPPEQTGAFALQSFAEEVLGQSELAVQFRAAFDVVIIPVINPDGVELGYWRHNTGGLDLNRDWGPFTQPETQAVKAWLDGQGERDIRLFLDFHSTQRNVFYTQTDEDSAHVARFTRDWLAAAGERLTSDFYDFERAQRHNTDLPTSKNYMYSRYYIPAITYEVGDETDRAAIDAAARIFAQEMMEELLAGGAVSD